ncbi:MAG: metallophosphoesterase family protein [Promethearchaeota archaeon]
MENGKIKVLFSILMMVSFSTVGILMISTVESQSTATIVYPRFGCAIRTLPSSGPGENTSDYLGDTVTFWVAPDPTESTIPGKWLKKNNWDVALTPSVMPSANLTSLRVERVVQGTNPLALFGGNLDVNLFFPSAIGIVCSIPADIVPTTYNLAIGYKTSLTPEVQQSGTIDLLPKPGSWRGPRGSASSGFLKSNEPFVLTDQSVVSIPWAQDALSSDGAKNTDGGMPVNPFTAVHVTDPHYDTNPEASIQKTWWDGNNSLWERDMSVIAPDIIILSGDVVENPGEEEFQGAGEYNLAYSRLGALELPLAIVSGNHDNKNIGLWKHFFGPLFFSTTFDDLKVVGFDSTLPVGNDVLNWIDAQSNRVNGGPVFMTCHYNIDPTYFPSGWVGIGDMMIRKNTTAILVGHTHSDMVGSISKLRDATYSNAGDLITGEYDDVRVILEDALELTNVTTGYLQPIGEPQIIMTRSAAKQSNVLAGALNFTNDTLDYSGYRILSIQNNRVYNYTYDYDGDGTRDPQVAYPVGLFHTTLEYDLNIGTDTSAGANWTLNNTSNEELRAARAIFELPSAPANYTWDLNPANKSTAFIRAQITNGTHWWVDVRVSSAPNSITMLRMEPVPE